MTENSNYPIPTHPSWEARDPSKFKNFRACKREFFFEYLLGWRLDSVNIDLHFGTSWHSAMEYLLLNGYETHHQMKAIDAFLKTWREEIDEEYDDMDNRKSPSAVINAIPQYCDANARDHEEFEVLYTEIAGTVPIAEDRIMCFRMDSVLRNIAGNFIYSSDHKSKGGAFSWMWEQEFLLALQTFTYTHCLYCLHPPEQVKGIEFNGAAFEFLKKTGYRSSFKRVPAWKTADQMNVWLWEINDLWSDLDYEMERLAQCSESDDVLMAFPRNEGSCTKYRGCTYHDFCMTWSNPLQHCFKPPLGYKIEFWDPREKPATNEMKLER